MNTKNVGQVKETQSLKVVNWHKALQNAVLDPAVNIKISLLAGNADMMMGITELQPGAKITAHVHQEGTELYHILKGEGEIYTGAYEKGNVLWNAPTNIKEGDIFAVEPGMVHQLKNTSKHHPLTLIFSCPHEHLKTDRILTEDYQE